MLTDQFAEDGSSDGFSGRVADLRRFTRPADGAPAVVGHAHDAALYGVMACKRLAVALDHNLLGLCADFLATIQPPDGFSVSSACRHKKTGSEGTL